MDYFNKKFRLDYLESIGIKSKYYLNDWIFYFLFLRDCEKIE